MPSLILVTLIWALAFNVIGTYVSGQVDGYFAVLTRVVIGFLVFLPFTRWKQQHPKFLLGVVVSGAFQFGFTYLFLYQSFRFISTAEVMLFTVLTPLHIAVLYDALHRRFRWQNVLTSLLAVAGAAIIRWKQLDSHFWTGFLLMQCANASFAAGMVLYKRLLELYPNRTPLSRSFAWFFLGALLVIAPAYAWLGDANKMPSTLSHVAALLFLGIFATALGQYLWNQGSSQVSIGTVAVMNNAVIPLGILLNWWVFNHTLPWRPFTFGSLLMVGALVLNSRFQNASHQERSTRKALND